MKLPARKFAGALWIGAAIVMISLWGDIAIMTYIGNVSAGQYALELVFVIFVGTIANAGLLVAFGAVIYVLGEVRDRMIGSTTE